MSRNKGSNSTPALVVLGLVVVSFLVCGVLLGPGHALVIASSAASSTVLDGFAEQPVAHRMPVLDVRIDPDRYQAITNGGAERVAARILIDGVNYHAQVGSKAGGLGPKQPLHIAFDDPPVRYPFKSIELLNPATADMIEGSMALWIAGDMGVPVAYAALCFVRINGKDVGVMELREQVSADFERVRAIAPTDVQVASSLQPDQWPITDPLSNSRAVNLVVALSDQALTSYARRDTIQSLVDVDAYLRLLAAHEVLNTNKAHHVWVFGPRTGTFYPVLTSAGLMDAHAESIADGTDSLMARALLDVPEWRMRRDRYVQEAQARLLDDDLFLRQWQEAEQVLRPSLVQDRNRRASLDGMGDATYGYSVRRAVGTSAASRRKAIDHWADSRTTALP